MEIILFFYLYFTLLCVSWKPKRILENRFRYVRHIKMIVWSSILWVVVGQKMTRKGHKMVISQFCLFLCIWIYVLCIYVYLLSKYFIIVCFITAPVSNEDFKHLKFRRIFFTTLHETPLLTYSQLRGAIFSPSEKGENVPF